MVEKSKRFRRKAKILTQTQGEKPSAAVTQMAGPPPAFNNPTPPPPSTGGPPSMDGPSGPPSFTSPVGGGTRRMRYVDTFNQGTTAPTAPAPARRDSGARQSLNFAGTIFTPSAMMPAPTEQPTTEYQQQEEHQQQQQMNTFQTPFSQPPQNM